MPGRLGLGPAVGGLLVGVGSSFMLGMPVWGALARRFGIRRVSLFWFPLASFGSLVCGLMTGWPWVAARIERPDVDSSFESA